MMGGNSNSTVQPNANALASLFGSSQGYQQTPVAPAIQQPAYPTPALTPEQAALATQARMAARNPVAPPVIQQKRPVADIQRGGNGDSHGRGSGGAW